MLAEMAQTSHQSRRVRQHTDFLPHAVADAFAPVEILQIALGDHKLTNDLVRGQVAQVLLAHRARVAERAAHCRLSARCTARYAPGERAADLRGDADGAAFLIVAIGIANIAPDCRNVDCFDRLSFARTDQPLVRAVRALLALLHSPVVDFEAIGEFRAQIFRDQRHLREIVDSALVQRAEHLLRAVLLHAELGHFSSDFVEAQSNDVRLRGQRWRVRRRSNNWRAGDRRLRCASWAACRS